VSAELCGGGLRASGSGRMSRVDGMWPFAIVSTVRLWLGCGGRARRCIHHGER
jgi:hypothetical protein